MEGRVKWFNYKKGYGFVEGDDGNEYFVHFTQVPQGVRLQENDRVSFEGSDTERGKQAKNISLLENTGNNSESAQPEEQQEAAAEPEDESGNSSEDAAAEESSEESSEEEPQEAQ